MRKALGLLLALSGGCMVGPDYVRPDAAVNKEWVEGEEDKRVRRDTPTELEWWKTLKDPMLDKLIVMARSQNLGLRAAGVRVLQSMAARGISVGALFPQAQELNGAYTRSKASENGPGPGGYSSSYGVGFDAAWELDFWGKFRRNIEAADAELDGTLANYDDVMVTLVSEVALAYIDIRTTQARIKIAQENVKRQEDGTRLADERFKAGQTSELDPTQVKALLAQLKADIPALETTLRQAMYRLTFLLGQPPRDILDELGEPGKIPAVPTEIAIGIPADLLRRRPDIRLAEREAAAQSARIGVAKAEMYPAFFLSGGVGLSASSASDLLSSGSWTGSITPGFSWPIFNYGRLKNNVRVQDAGFQAAILNYRNSVLAAAQEVESGLVSFLRGQDRATLLAEAVAETEKSLDLARTQYAEGTADFQRVLDALASLQQVQDALVRTQGQVVASLIATQKSLGGGWELREGLDLVPEKTKQEMEERTNWGGLLDADYASGRDLGVKRHDPSKLPN
ncbi:MAG: efflux transporter outer membrane subunit [Planctomycetota bacterium]|jgi:NodT family efflux transporter outer membrane factor (OMF) lipoprotein